MLAVASLHLACSIGTGERTIITALISFFIIIVINFPTVN